MRIALHLIVLFVLSVLLGAGQCAYACEMRDSGIQTMQHTADKAVRKSIQPAVKMNHDSGCCAHGVSVCCMIQSSFIAFSVHPLPSDGKILIPFVSYYSLSVSPDERPPTV